jgi:hypothetical protein
MGAMAGAGRQPDATDGGPVVSQGITAAVLTLAALASTVLVISHVIRLLLDRLRMAGWEADWSIVEPRWTGRWPHR